MFVVYFVPFNPLNDKKSLNDKLILIENKQEKLQYVHSTLNIGRIGIRVEFKNSL